jgi:diguanylate cyclase
MDLYGVASAVTVIGSAVVVDLYRRRAMRAETESGIRGLRLATSRQAMHWDPPTKLLNRRAFYDRGSTLLADHIDRPLVAVMVDIDNFRAVNSALGHVVGDHVLSIVAGRFADYITGHVIGRLDGNELAALLPQVTTADNRSYPDLQVLREILATPIWACGHWISITVSAAQVTVNGSSDIDDVLNRAETALADAKPNKSTDRCDITGAIQMATIQTPVAPANAHRYTASDHYRSYHRPHQHRRVLRAVAARQIIYPSMTDDTAHA